MKVFGRKRMDSEDRVERRVVPNMVSNVVFMLVNFAMGLLLVPFYIDQLGNASYAIIPVATSVTSYIVIISDSLSSTVSRYLTIDLRTDINVAKHTYNTAVIGFTGLLIVAIPVILLISVLAPSIFSIASNSVISVQILFVLILASVLITVWSNNFITVLFSKNRIDLMNVVKTTQVLVQIILVIVLLLFVSKSVEYVGAAYFIASIVYAVLGYVLARKVCPELRVRRHSYDKQKFREMAVLGGWSLVNNLGNLLFIQTSLLLVNIFLGADDGGYFGVIVTVISAVSALIDTMGSIFAPITYRLFSEKRVETMNSVTKLAVKVVGLVMSMPIAFLCVFSVPILTLWVGAEYQQLEPVVWAVMFLMVGIGAITPAYPLTMVHLKVRIPGIVTLLFGVANVVLALAVIAFTDLGIMGVGLVWSLTMFVKNCVFNPWYIARISGMGRFDIHRSLAYGYLSFVMLVIVYGLLDHVLAIPVSWLWFGLLGIALLGVHMLVTLKVFLNDDEREVVKSCIPGSLRRVVDRICRRSRPECIIGVERIDPPQGACGC